MSDPFRPEIHRQLYREAQIGLIVVLLLLSVLIYVILYKSARLELGVPNHVRQSPIAKSVWPFSEEGNIDREDRMQPEIQPPFQVADRTQFVGSRFVKAQDFQPIENEPASFKKQTKIQLLDCDAGCFEHDMEMPERDFLPKQGTNPDHGKLGDGFVQQSEQESQRNHFEAAVTEEKKLLLDPFSISATDRTNPHNNGQPGHWGSPLDPFQSIGKADDDSGSVNDFAERDNQPERESFVSDFDASGRLAMPLAQNSNVEIQEIRSFVINQNDFDSTESSPSQSMPTKIDGLTDTSVFLPLPRSVPVDDNRSFNQSIVSGGMTDAGDQPINLIDSPAGYNQIKSSILVKQANAIDVLSEASGKNDESDQPQSYVVVQGDSFWSISQEYYQDGNFFRALYEHNADNIDSFELSVEGTRIEIPSKELLRRQFPDLCPQLPASTNNNSKVPNNNQGASGTFYLTKDKDNLFDIAARELGQASRYLEIIELNPEILPYGVDHLSPLPADLRLRLSRN